MKTTTVLSALLLISAGFLAGCSDLEAEKQEAKEAALYQFLNQNPEGRVRSIEELKNIDPNTGKPRAPKESDGKN